MQNQDKFEEVYASADFIETLNAHNLICRSDYANEFFLYYYVRLLEIRAVSSRYLDLGVNFSPWRVSWNLLRLSRKAFFKQKASKSRAMFFSFIPFVTSMVGLFLTILIYFYSIIRVENGARPFEANESNDIYLVRSKSGADKLSKICTTPRALFLTDDLLNYARPSISSSIYSPVRTRKSLKVLWHAIKFTVRDHRLCFDDAKSMFDELTALSILFRYSLRISHKSLYESCLYHFLIETSPRRRVYTANKEDRFAILETRLCTSLGFRLHCVPHGLEYGFRFPIGLCGTVFYCNSYHAALVLNDLYNDKKFVYCKDITARIFSADIDSAIEEKAGLCYFSEPRDAYVNFEIIEWMRTHNVDFCLKLHPLEDKESYLRVYPDIKIVFSLDEALAYRFCAARKSTVLLEAAYRSRIPVAILINLKDRVYCERIFPALSDTRIEKIYSLEELPALIVRRGLG